MVAVIPSVSLHLERGYGTVWELFVDVNSLSILGDKLETGGRRMGESCDVP